MGRQIKKEYPEWIQKHRREGTTVKEIRGKYYLYKRKTSKRVEGKKNPQPVYVFLGTITEEGLVPAKKRRLDVTDVKVREFGFSYALEKACPDSWKQIQGARWEDKLMAVILSRSKNSFVLDVHDQVKTPGELRIQLGATAASLGRKLKEAYGVGLDEIQALDTIYLVSMDGNVTISRVSENQQGILDRLGVCVEVPQGYC